MKHSTDTVSEHTAGCPEDEQLPLMTGVPSANVLARKTLKQRGEESYGTPRENPQVTTWLQNYQPLQ